MAANNFVPCLTITLAHEGGWSSHKADPGGDTMKGVIQKTYDRFRKLWGKALQSVRYIADDELRTIYREGYWDEAKCETLDWGVDLCTFDGAVNSGPARSRKWLMASIGGAGKDTISLMCKKRMGFLEGLKHFATFKRGWVRRVTDIEAKALIMWGEHHMNQPAVNKGEPARVEAKRAEASSKNQTGAAGASTVGAGGAGTNAGTDTVPVDNVAGFDGRTLVIILAIVLAIAAAGFAYKAYINRRRAQALNAAANGVSHGN